MADLKVSPDYLTKLSSRMGAWVSESLEPAIAAVPGEWASDGMLVASAVGNAILGAAGGAGMNFDKLKGGYDAVMKKDFNVKGFSFTGSQAYQAGWMLYDLYTIYSKLESGDPWGAALAALGIIPRFISIAGERDGMDALFKSGGGTTEILDYTSYALIGVGLCFGVGISDQKEVFTGGADQSSAGSAALRQLMPESDWQGSASTGYGETVAQLQELMDNMSAADTQLANILQLEEDQLQVTRNIITTAKKTIAYAKPMAMAIHLSPQLGGPPASNVFQTSTAVATFAAAVGGIGNQLNLSYLNGEQVKSQQQQYLSLQSEEDRISQRLS